MQQSTLRTSFSSRRPKGVAETPIDNGSSRRDGTPLFRRRNSGQPYGGGGIGGGQFASEALRASSASRPRTTGSVQQLVTAEVRRQSANSINRVSRQSLSSGIASRSQQQQLTRGPALGDLEASMLPVGDREDSGLLIRRGWQLRGTSGRSISAARGLGDIRPPGIPSGALATSLSRLPHLEPGQRNSLPGLVENAELLEHGMAFGVSALKGRRPYMEDEYKVIPHLELTGSSTGVPRDAQDTEPTHFFGLFDGHAGGRCSKALTQILAQTVSREADFSLELASAVRNGFLRANAEFLRKAERFSANDGSTAITAFVRGRRVVVGNVGDSRAVLCSDGRAAPLSSDHKPNKPEERRRIQALGGRVVYSFGIPRVNGILAVSRAFGDRNMRGSINAEPEIRERLLERGDDFLLLATDGVWDVMSSQEACNIVYSCAPELGPQVCSDVLTATALRKGSMDNTSALVIDLRGLWDATTSACHRRGACRRLLTSTGSPSPFVGQGNSSSNGGGQLEVLDGPGFGDRSLPTSTRPRGQQAAQSFRWSGGSQRPSTEAGDECAISAQGVITGTAGDLGGNAPHATVGGSMTVGSSVGQSSGVPATGRPKYFPQTFSARCAPGAQQSAVGVADTTVVDALSRGSAGATTRIGARHYPDTPLWAKTVSPGSRRVRSRVSSMSSAMLAGEGETCARDYDRHQFGQAAGATTCGRHARSTDMALRLYSAEVSRASSQR